MYGIYGDIISAAQKATEKFEETQELLEYPELQADKAYYLSVLSEYNELKSIKDKLAALLSALNSERAAAQLLLEATSDDERDGLYEEISFCKRKAAEFSVAVADALGCKHAVERAYVRFKLTAASSKFGVPLCLLIKEYLLSRGAKIEDEDSARAASGYLREISFTATGEDILKRLSPLTGAHKILIPGAKSEELCIAVTPASEIEKLSESDLKIDIFHSSGAGGQHVNKVETAVRITHIPTGITVTCQDERSQLANKKRALETIENRLTDMRARSEKKRIEADIYAQYRKKNTPISFDYISSTMTDTRLASFCGVPFPPEDFSSYVDSLTVL